jgi:hypothetical protein
MIIMGDEAMSEAPSYYYKNKELLLQTIMNQLSIEEEDLSRETSWIKAKIREANIDKVLEN